MTDRGPSCFPIALSAAALLIAHVAALEAGGPLEVKKGSAITWDNNQAITYRRDRGPLGAIPQNEVHGFIDEAFRKWAAVSTTRLRFTPATLPLDVKTSVRYLSLADDPASGNVVILDNVGRIIEGVFGPANKNKILGFASPRLNGTRITRFIALMNGALADNKNTVRSTLVHEIGHALGLDHSQINSSLAADGDSDNDRFLPTMFPTSSDDDSHLIDLNPDDVAWISRLYPSGDAQKRYGLIRGRLARVPSAAVLGANVIAIAILNGNDDHMARYSCVSDYLMSNDGSFDLWVLPGQYKLRVEPIRRDFVSGSSVGPYALNLAGLSFKNPVRAKTFAAVHAVTAGNLTDVGTLTVQ